MDIDYLKDIGKVDSFPLSIDSSLRDMRVFPTPSEYEVTFDTPFTNVIGFDILDATIPNTMYAVDDHNNSLSFVVRIGGLRDDELQSNGKPLSEYFLDLMKSDEFGLIWNDSATSKIRAKFTSSLYSVESLQIQTGEINPEVESMVIMDQTITLFPLDAAGALALGIPAIPIDLGVAHTLTYDAGTEQAFLDGSEIATTTVGGGDVRVLVSAVETDQVTKELVTRYATVSAITFADAPVGHASKTHYPVTENGGLVSLVDYGIFRVTSEFYNGIVNQRLPNNMLVSFKYLHELEFHNLYIDLGDHDIDTLVEALKFAMPTYLPEGVVNATDNDKQPIIRLSGLSLVNSDNYKRQRRIRFSSSFPFWMNMERSTIREVMGFSEMAREGSPEYTSYRLNDSMRIFGAPKVGESYILDTPGLVEVIGERLVVMRCPQIEEHAFPSLSHGKYSAGLGVFKLYDTTYAHLRFDFLKLNRLDFHPIGKLQRLRFRFERLNGELYNFKGVDHHLFISVKFLIPRNERTIPPPQSRLNPDYDPNVLRYEVTRQIERDESDTESDEELVGDDDHIRRYYENRRRFLVGEEARQQHLMKYLYDEEEDEDYYTYT